MWKQLLAVFLSLFPDKNISAIALERSSFPQTDSTISIKDTWLTGPNIKRQILGLGSFLTGMGMSYRDIVQSQLRYKLGTAKEF